MPDELLMKRTVAFVDGQNLYHSVRESFGYTYPNYDVVALSRSICQAKDWDLIQVRFYTGVPNKSDDPFWNHFWMAKLRVLSWQKVLIFSRHFHVFGGENVDLSQKNTFFWRQTFIKSAS